MNGVQSKAASPWRNPWIVGWLALVVVVLSVNLLMVYLAITTNPGLVVDDYYDRGQHYEKTLFERRAKSAELDTTLELPATLKVGEPARITFSARLKSNRVLQIESADLYLYRPADASRDFNAEMRPLGHNAFSAEIRFPLKGVWDLIVHIREGGQEHNFPRRIEVLPAD